MKKKNIEINESGLQCDNINCDWKDNTIMFNNYKDWLNKPCPKCGENVLTEEDYKNTLSFYSIIDKINLLSEEQLNELHINTDSNEMVSMIVNLHKGINIKEIKKN